MSPTTPIRVAISGGGLAGASLLHALSRYPHLDVHLFESAPALKESGMAIGLARNAQAALELLLPGPAATACLRRAGAVPMRGVSFMLAQGAGGVLDEVSEASAGRRLTSIVHRAALLAALLADAPAERLHVSKQLETVDRRGDGSLALRFADGSAHDCDVLVGADGIHSTVRKLILGATTAAPRNTGAWLVMTLQPRGAAARAGLGGGGGGGEGPVDGQEDAREYSWVGENSFVLHNLLSGGRLVQFVIASNDAEVAPGARVRTVTREEIERIYADWPSHLNQAVKELLCTQDEHRGMYLWEHPPARTYVDGPLCVVGDAAHATTPWQGAGGGMSIEDSLILSTLLGRAETPAQARTALKVYDRVRRPRTQRIVESSRGTGEILTGVSEMGLDKQKIGSLLRRWDFIIDIDMEGHRDEAVAMMDAELQGDAKE
ncbi:salicylate hydroxylase [Xylariomycetidae sp. FL0641]|nr:salicylate hydroxylase [Xylariomycetidae sp. FL0641]